MGPGFLTTAFDHRCNTRILLYFSSVIVTIPVCTEGREYSRCKLRTGAGKAIKDNSIFLGAISSSDFFIKRFNAGNQHSQLFDKELDQQFIGLDDTRVRS